MSVLKGESDKNFHFPGGNHRWTSPDPDEISDRDWKALVQAHVDAHAAGQGANGNTPSRLVSKYNRPHGAKPPPRRS